MILRKMLFRSFLRFTFNITILLIVFFLISGCSRLPFIKEKLIEQEEAKTRFTIEAIKNSPELQELDSLCKSLPKPESFTLSVMDKSHNSKDIWILYGYHSSLKNEVVKEFYKDYLAKNGWELVDDGGGLSTQWLRFRKGNIKIEIDYGGTGEGWDYGITCQKLQV